jgi:hypothetical protein
MFVKKFKPIFWLEGPYIVLSQDRDFFPNGYCLIGSAPSSEVNYFATAILAPCENRAEYQFIAPREKLTKSLDGFPSSLPMVEIQINLNEPRNLDAVNIIAPIGLGNWTTLPIQNTWGIAVVDKVGNEYKIRNEGQRMDRMNLPHENKLTLWLPDNGKLTKCPELQIELVFDGGKHFSSVADCN